MAKVDFKDRNNNVLAHSVLPDGFKTEAVMQVENRQYDQIIRLSLDAEKEGCSIHVRTSGSYDINKIQQPQINYYMPPQPDPNARRELSDIRKDLDDTAAAILNKAAGKGTYFDLSQKFKDKAAKDLREYINHVADNIYLGAQASPIPIGGVFRNYLLDGALALYEADGHYLAVCVYRLGVEADLLNNYQGISENLSDKPFAKADISMNAIASSASVAYPFVFYMLSDQKEDLKIFMTFVDEFELSKQLLDYQNQLYQNNLQQTFQKAQLAALETQNIINATWQMHNQQMASMDRVREMVSRDLDDFHNNLNQQMHDFDSRLTASSSYGESLDDKIQRGRHEAMMGVETYERSDGTTVEFDSRADRVFENNLDSVTHFGTEHYYGDYVPDGWHELKKK